ncbi:MULTISPECIES: hypothetical protein [Mesorhizobium]|uniref:Uncharacterized protein n=2 Tax=Mesorhizobium TaxID=68287 RepID=A0ABU4ZRG2_9HYPH|nr:MULTISPECIES: hypothetical protein [unclassified Mesorhizobium]MDX8480806.1 hypothetical protein [Mesorhizobium sp. VK24D]MDX8515481.1 hypothetical protein [Mesorhizobium sp. VK23E]MDX8528003.1 hypothetical protein [Mesorhizobium sp. MSK_1335]
MAMTLSMELTCSRTSACSFANSSSLLVNSARFSFNSYATLVPRFVSFRLETRVNELAQEIWWFCHLMPELSLAATPLFGINRHQKFNP